MQPIDLFERLLELGRDHRGAEIARLPGAGIHREVLRLADLHLPALLHFFDGLPPYDREVFVEAVALYEHTVGGLGSVTTLQNLLPMVGDAHDAVLDWILRNTNSYSYYAYEARSLEEYRAICSRRAKRKADAEFQETNRQAQAKARIAERATTLLYNAVRRGDLKAVRALLVRGADPTTKAPDGTSLDSLAIGNHRHDIAAELQAHMNAS